MWEIGELWPSTTKTLCSGLIPQTLEQLILVFKIPRKFKNITNSERILASGASLFASLANGTQFPKLQGIQIYLEKLTCRPSTNEKNVQSVVEQELGLGGQTKFIRVTLCEVFVEYEILKCKFIHTLCRRCSMTYDITRLQDAYH